jgi:hypothetical protein
MTEESIRYQKDLLRRLGVKANLQDTEEFYVQMIAAAKLVGVSDEQFWNSTPRELCAVLELKATEFELLRRWAPEATRRSTTVSSEVEPSEPKSRPVVRAGSRGPKRDYETAARVAEIVRRLVPKGDWKLKIDEICQALDAANVPYPPLWKKRYKANSWIDYPEKSVAVKAIEGRLKTSQNASTPGSKNFR